MRFIARAEQSNGSTWLTLAKPNLSILAIYFGKQVHFERELGKLVACVGPLAASAEPN